MAISFFALCFLSLIIGQTDGNFYGSHSASDHAVSALVESTASLKREKRQSDDYCVILCASDMLSNFDSRLPELSSSLNEYEEKGPSYTNMFTEYQFKTFCKDVYKPFDRCLDRCQMTQSLAIWKNRLSSLKYMCVDYYNDFYNSLPCRRSVRNETITKCIDNVCQQRKNAPVHLRKAANNLKFTKDFEGLKYHLAETCKLISCVSSCEEQIIKDRCGLNVMKLMRDYSTVHFSSIHKGYQLRDLSWIYPTECINLAAYNITQTMRPRVDLNPKADYLLMQNFKSTASNRHLNTLLILLLQFFCFAAVGFGLY